MRNAADKVQQGKTTIVDGVKKHIFDWIAAIIVVSLIAASLDLFGLIDFNSINVLEFLISWFPYFAAAILLNLDLYKKGVFIGKSTDKFKNVIESYSGIANSLSGEQIKGLYPFCENYNETAKQAIQKQILRKEGLIFEEFDEPYVEQVGEKTIKHLPLKVLSKQELQDLKYTKKQIKAIKLASKVKVKGISVNLLLSSTDTKDTTRIGDDERSLQAKRMLTSIVKYIGTTVLLSVVAIKNIGDWGWMGLILTLFKVAYLFAGCCMSYFKGYDDVTIHLSSHFTRKSDILKMYLNYVPEQNEQFIYENAQQQS